MTTTVVSLPGAPSVICQPSVLGSASAGTISSDASASAASAAMVTSATPGAATARYWTVFAENAESRSAPVRLSELSTGKAPWEVRFAGALLGALVDVLGGAVTALAAAPVSMVRVMSVR